MGVRFYPDPQVYGNGRSSGKTCETCFGPMSNLGPHCPHCGMHQDGLGATMKTAIGGALALANVCGNQIQGAASGPPTGGFGGYPIGSPERPLEKVTVASSGRKPNHARPHMLAYQPDRSL